MIADEPRPTPAIGIPDSEVLNVGAFHREIVAFIERELPVWRRRPDRPQVTDEPRLNETLCDHLDCASRRQCFDSIRFCHEPYQSSGREADIAVKPAGTIKVEGRAYCEFEQLLPIECKRLPTPPDKRRNDLEYVHGLLGHRTGGIERFKHGLHGPANQCALIIAYVQAESFAHWLALINARLALLAQNGTDNGLWQPVEPLSSFTAADSADVHKFTSHHRRISPPSCSESVDMEHLWLRMN